MHREVTTKIDEKKDEIHTHRKKAAESQKQLDVHKIKLSEALSMISKVEEKCLKMKKMSQEKKNQYDQTCLENDDLIKVKDENISNLEQ